MAEFGGEGYTAAVVLAHLGYVQLVKHIFCEALGCVVGDGGSLPSQPNIPFGRLERRRIFRRPGGREALVPMIAIDA